MKIFAVMPAWNEEQTIEEVLKKTKKHVNEIIVVNDGSTDNTAKIAKKYATVINNPVNLGAGMSTLRGIFKALEDNADVIILIDSDGQHPPEAIPKFVEKIKEGYEFVFAFRESRKQMPFVKKFGNLFSDSQTGCFSTQN